MIRPQPPKMRKETHTTTVHGQTLNDDYFWFRHRENPEVLEHLKQENEYTEAHLESVRPLRDKLFQELKARIKEEDSDYPYQLGENFYYAKVVAGKEYRILCRKKGSLDAPEEILLDLNELAAGKDYFSLGYYEISPNQKYMAYSIDDDGSEKYRVYFKDIETGKMLPDVIQNVFYSLEWFNDSHTVVYNRLNDKHRPDQVLRHELGQDPSKDQVIFRENDPEYFVSLRKSLSEEFIFIHCGGAITSEEHYLDAHSPLSTPQLIAPRKKGCKYDADHGRSGYFYIRTNDQAINFRVLEAPIGETDSSKWKELIAHSPEVYIQAVMAFRDFFVLFEREDGLQHFRIVDQKTRQSHRIRMPEPNYMVTSLENPNFDSQYFRFAYSSLTSPGITYDYDVNSRQLVTRKQKEVNGYDPSRYVTKRIFAVSHDGTKVPLSVLHRKDLAKDGSAPCYLYGYGSYGSSSPPAFRPNILSMVDRGFVFAIAHVRGGSEMGRQWYENGKFLKKKNTFLDFVAAAETLIKEKYTRAGEIAIVGASAGGMLVGATMNLRPDLLKAVVAHVPFVDVINTMLDETLPLTTIEYDEWGNPKDKQYFDYMLSYSPYDNVEAKAYPAVLATAGLNDPRVTYWEPAKWVAKLREKKTDNNPVLLHTNMEAGHGGKSGRFEALKDTALEYAFILNTFNIKQ